MDDVKFKLREVISIINMIDDYVAPQMCCEDLYFNLKKDIETKLYEAISILENK